MASITFAAVGLKHSHVGSMMRNLIEAGASLKWIYDDDPTTLAFYAAQFPQARVAREESEVLEDQEIKLVASADMPSRRFALGKRVIQAGKDYFVDKAPFSTLGELEQARSLTAQTGMKYAVFYNERIISKAVAHAKRLIEAGEIGRVIHMTGFGPHAMGNDRPDWYHRKVNNGAIHIDIGCHQIDQFLYLSGSQDARLLESKVVNFNHPQYPELDDYGDASFVGDNGALLYYRVDWFTPRALGTFGDGRIFILGTEGYIELRKYIDVARGKAGNQLYLVNQTEQRHFDLNDQPGTSFFRDLIQDCLNRTETASVQKHDFRVAELSMLAQRDAKVMTNHTYAEKGV
ncbi:Gfo/Idh/MocA family protein [Paenibacillus roseipurpureus]|uniref:Gfo/Idh/MocA family oxidoreductase n=1 Tax=Paenibacillus roseopurpureus TaxID=2918901 RepID=A0AA96LMW8_9BACL|nr:Gfo/Idh/MocA family oxidoreductase [Paenibacillus sp. MBLB1832]WNR43481.1 Gfo/Idh/MocA family oxidoreductase [Paenibacillus sp. MBLB1832]